MIKSQLGNYAKEKIDDFVSNNEYQVFEGENNSFDLFNRIIYYDGTLLYKLSCKDQFQEYITEQMANQRIQDHLNGFEAKNIMASNLRIDLYPYIQSKQFEKDFFEFLISPSVYLSLYECVEKDVASNRDTLIDFRTLLLNKLSFINNKKNNYTETLLSTPLTNQTLIHWYVLLEKYITKVTTLLDNKIVSRLDTKLIIYILKTFCKSGINIDTSDESFVNFTKELMGTSQSTTEKYLKSSNMSYNGFVNTWLDGLRLLSSLDKENSIVRKCIKEALKDRPVKLPKPLTLEQENFLQSLKNEYI